MEVRQMTCGGGCERMRRRKIAPATSAVSVLAAQKPEAQDLGVGEELDRDVGDAQRLPGTGSKQESRGAL